MASHTGTRNDFIQRPVFLNISTFKIMKVVELYFKEHFGSMFLFSSNVYNVALQA